MTSFTPVETAAMRRALRAAACPDAPPGPNPRVGCVILSADGDVLAKGHHRGAGTALADDPALTVRDETGKPAPAHLQPLRVIVGSRRLPPTSRVLADDHYLLLPDHDPHTVLAVLAERKIRHVLLEGGPTLATAFLRAGVVDEVVAYTAPALLGAGPAAVANFGATTITDALRLRHPHVEVLGSGDELAVRLSGDLGTDDIHPDAPAAPRPRPRTQRPDHRDSTRPPIRHHTEESH